MTIGWQDFYDHYRSITGGTRGLSQLVRLRRARRAQTQGGWRSPVVGPSDGIPAHRPLAHRGGIAGTAPGALPGTNRPMRNLPPGTRGNRPQPETSAVGEELEAGPSLFAGGCGVVAQAFR